MHGWETKMLLKHYLGRGVSKAALSRRFGMSRRTIHEWVETGQLDRDLSSGDSRYAPRPPAPHTLDPYTGIIDARLAEYPGLSAQRLFGEVRATGYPGGYSRVRDYVHRCVPASRPSRWCGSRRRRGVRARWTSRSSPCPGAAGRQWPC